MKTLYIASTTNSRKVISGQNDLHDNKKVTDPRSSAILNKTLNTRIDSNMLYG